MKKQLFILPALVFLTLQSYAQPVLTQANTAFQSGDDFLLLYVDTTLSTGPAGANVTWDFSGVLTIPGGLTLDRKTFAASATPFSSTFPMANIATQEGPGTFTYYISNNDSLVLCGIKSSTNRFYSDYHVIMPFPFAYGDVSLDNYFMTTTIPAGTITHSGTVAFEADAYGTLIMPGGMVVDNVLRVKTNTQVIVSSPSGTTVNAITDYYWYKPGIKHYIFRYSTSDALDYVYYMDPGFFTGMKVNETQERVRLYPNPVKQGNDLEITWDRSENCLVSVIDLSGKVVINREILSAKGVLKLSTVNLPAGMYTVNVKGTVETSSRLVVME